jgi:hypothetical protein
MRSIAENLVGGSWMETAAVYRMGRFFGNANPARAAAGYWAIFIVPV